MNIALCISGQLRDFRYTKKSLDKHILSRLKKYNTHLFGHYPVDPNNSCQSVNFLHFTDVQIEDETQVPSPSFCLSAHEIDYRPWHHSNPLRSFFLQLRSIYIANQLRKEFEIRTGISFDWVFRLRFDSLYYGACLENLSFCSPEHIYIPKHDNWWGYNDRFAFGGPGLMDIYCERYTYFEKYMRQGNTMHPEVFLKWILDAHKIPVRRTDVSSHLLRYGSFYRAVYNEKLNDVPSRRQLLLARLEVRLRSTRYSRLVHQAYQWISSITALADKIYIAVIRFIA